MQLKQQDFDSARLATERFRKLIAVCFRPLLRAVTNNDKLVVEVHPSAAMTDGKTVWLPIPLALGAETLEHDKTLCGRRDPASLKILCEFCAVEDSIQGLVFHESAHITEKSFRRIDPNIILKTMQRLFKDQWDGLTGEQRKLTEDRVRRAPTAMQAAGALDTWLPFTTNVIEDIYVNRRLFSYREGVELPLRLHSQDLFENGIKSADGTVSSWKDNDPSAQAIISAYLAGQNLVHLAKHLDPRCDLTQDAEILQLVGSIPSDCSVDLRIEIAMKLIVRLRELGFCPPKSDSVLAPPQPPTPPSEPQPSMTEGESEPEPGQGESGEGEPSGGEQGEPGDGQSEGGDEAGEEQGEGSGQAEPGDDNQGEPGDGQAVGEGDEQGEPSAGEGRPAKSDGGDQGEPGDGQAVDDGGEQGEPSQPEGPTDAEIEEQAKRAEQLLTHLMGHDDTGNVADEGSAKGKMLLERVLLQEGFDHPSEEICGVELITRQNDPKGLYSRFVSPHQEVKVPQSTLTPSLNRLQVVFAANHKTGLERSLKSGSRLDARHLHRIGTDDPRIFGKRNVPKSRDWFVLVGIDFSGSTLSNGADYAFKMAGHAIGELLNQLGIRFAMYAHTSTRSIHGGMKKLEHVEIKSPSENWRTRGVQDTLFLQQGRATNLDGHSLEQYRKIIEGERATDKLLMYFTDGEMPCANFDEEIDLLKENIEILRRQKVNLIGCGYRTDSPKRHGLDTIQFDSPDDIKSIVKGLEARLLR